MTNLLFVIFTIACAVSSNLNMLIDFIGIVRSAVLTIRGGIVADLFIPQERGKALAAWTMGSLFGPVLGLVIGLFFFTRGYTRAIITGPREETLTDFLYLKSSLVN